MGLVDWQVALGYFWRIHITKVNGVLVFICALFVGSGD